jgi:hypothetical protein
MFEVLYIIKDVDGYIKEKKAKFYHLQDAIRFVRTVSKMPAAGTKVIGKPMIERV